MRYIILALLLSACGHKAPTDTSTPNAAPVQAVAMQILDDSQLTCDSIPTTQGGMLGLTLFLSGKAFDYNLDSNTVTPIETRDIELTYCTVHIVDAKIIVVNKVVTPPTIQHGCVWNYCQ